MIPAETRIFVAEMGGPAAARSERSSLLVRDFYQPGRPNLRRPSFDGFLPRLSKWRRYDVHTKVALCIAAAGFALATSRRRPRCKQSVTSSLRSGRLTPPPGERREPDGFGCIFRVARRLLWRKPFRAQASWYAFLMLAALAIANAVAVVQSYVQRDCMSALANGDPVLFGKKLILSLVLLAAGMPWRCLAEFATGGLSIIFRDSATRTLLQEYYSPQRVYWLRRDGRVREPDAPIAVESGHFAECSAAMTRDVLENSFKLLGFIGVVFAISPALCFSMVVYALVGAIATSMLFGRPLVKADRALRAQEATLRASIARNWDKAEALVLSGGESTEGAASRRKYEELRRTHWSRVSYRTGLAGFKDCLGWAAHLLPLAFVAPLWLRGEVPFGVVSQTVVAFQASLAALSVVVRKFRSVSSMVAEGSRLESLADALVRAASQSSGPNLEKGGSGLEACGMSLHLPSGAPLSSNITFSLKPSERVLVRGESGIGKTTLVRALAGLWPCGSGQIRRSPSVVFLSQDPYLPAGSLRGALSFPAEEGTYSDSELIQAAESVKLSSVLERHSLNDTGDWMTLLSRGEQQRCAFCRLFLVRPHLAVLDEATASLDVDAESALYNSLESQCVLSIGHRPSLRNHHTHEFFPDGSTSSGGTTWRFARMLHA